MAIEKDASKILVNAWAKVQWTIGQTLTDLGFTGVPTVKLTPEYTDKLTGQTGKLALGKMWTGLAVEIVTPLLQPDAELLRAMVPWAAAQGSIALTPDVLGYDIYDKAALMNLHPLSADLGEEEDLTQDLNLVKSVPVGGLHFTRDGQAQDVVPVSWAVFPDREQLPLIVYGYIGEVPAEA